MCEYITTYKHVSIYIISYYIYNIILYIYIYVGCHVYQYACYTHAPMITDFRNSEQICQEPTSMHRRR